MDDKISVIIPVYNAEKTIDRCLKSVCNQTYSNLEIIIVNDGSVDNTGRMLEEWRQKDSRIVLLNNNNKGAAASRNLGMNHISGEVFTFIDADDYIQDKLYEYLHNEMSRKNLDIVSTSIKEIYDGERKEDRITYDSEVISGIEAARYMLTYQGGVRTVVWDKMYLAEKFKQIRFNEKYMYGEDTLFNFNALLRCERYGRIAYVGYTYDHTMSQLTQTRYTSKRMSNIYVVDEICDKCENVKTLQEAAKKFRLIIYSRVFQLIILTDSVRGNVDYQELVRHSKKLTNIKKYLGLKDTMLWYMFRWMPNTYKIVHKINHMTDLNRN